MFWQIVNMIQIVLLFICWLAVPIMVYFNLVQFLILFFDFSIEIIFIQLFTIVLIDAVNEGINEGCDLHEDSNGGVNWFDWDITTTHSSHDNTPWTTHGTHGTHDDHGNTLAWTTTIGGDGNPGSTTGNGYEGPTGTWASTAAPMTWPPGWTGSTPVPGESWTYPPGWTGSTPKPMTWPPGWTGSTPQPGVSWDPSWGLGPAWPPGWTGSTPAPGATLDPSWTWPPGWTGSTPNLDDLQAKMDEANSLMQEQLDQFDSMAGDALANANDLADQLGDISSDTMNDANDLVDNLDSNMDALFGKKRKKRDTTDDLCSAHEDNQVLTYFLVENKSINILTPKTPYHPLV